MWQHGHPTHSARYTVDYPKSALFVHFCPALDGAELRTPRGATTGKLVFISVHLKYDYYVNFGWCVLLLLDDPDQAVMSGLALGSGMMHLNEPRTG
jgi:hypothetical protein